MIATSIGSADARRCDPAQADALRDFVDKEERGAIGECVSKALEREQRDVLQRVDAPLEKEGDVAAAIAADRKQTAATPVSLHHR